MLKSYIWIIFAGLPLWIGGCQTYLDRIYLESAAANQELVRLRADFVEAARRQQASLAGLSDVEKSHFEILTAQLIDIDARLARLEQELAALRGRFQELEFQRQHSAAASPAAANNSQLPELEADAPPPDGDPLEGASGDGGEALYTQALQLYNTGNYSQAAKYFQLYLKEHAAERRAGDSQYWLAECLYGQNELNTALEAFEQTAARYPAHPSAPSALLKAALIYEELGEPDKALACLKKIQINHPNFEQLDRVKVRISEMEQSAPGAAQ